jgi:hypothetical protein
VGALIMRNPLFFYALRLPTATCLTIFRDHI